MFLVGLVQSGMRFVGRRAGDAASTAAADGGDAATTTPPLSEKKKETTAVGTNCRSPSKHEPAITEIAHSPT